MTLPELLLFVREKEKRDKDMMRWQAQLTIKNSLLTVSLLGGKNIDPYELFPGVFPPPDQKSFAMSDEGTKNFVLSRLGIDKRGGDKNGG